MVLFQATMSSIVIDFYIKVLGKDSGGINVLRTLPLIEGKYKNALIVRALLLNCVTSHYKELWRDCWDDEFKKDSWGKEDRRLSGNTFKGLSNEWTYSTPLRSDYERRQALLEIDVLVALSIGLTIDELKNIYRLQFNLMQQYEDDTWYDSEGRIVFSAKSMGELTYKRPEWERDIKGASEGQVFKKIIMDDTIPGGPIEREIEFVAPFDCCNRESDYEKAWDYFINKYEDVGGDQ